MKYWLIVVSSLILASAGNAQTAKDYSKDVEYKKFIERIAGEWTLQQVVDAEKRSTSGNAKREKPSKTNDPNTNQANNAMQKIEFFDNARYRMSSAASAVDSGSYRLNEQHGILYMQSDLGTTEPTEWKIDMQGNKLTLGGRGKAATSRYQYVYSKTKSSVVK